MKCECCGQDIPETSSARFDEFWAIYPTKVGRKKASLAWNRRKLDKIADVIIDSIRNRLDNDPQWEAGFVQNPTTYLNGDLWEDEIASVQKTRTWPVKNDDWMSLGSKYQINPGIGEGWPKYKDRVRRHVEAL